MDFIQCSTQVFGTNGCTIFFRWMVLLEQICYPGRDDLFQVLSNIYKIKVDFFVTRCIFLKTQIYPSITDQPVLNRLKDWSMCICFITVFFLWSIFLFILVWCSGEQHAPCAIMDTIGHSRLRGKHWLFTKLSTFP